MGALANKAWKQLSGELATAVDRDFERAVLPLIRLIWPQMVQPRGLAAYDKAGADLIALTENDRIECVVQCKGFFKVEGLADDQFVQINKSIIKFRKSGLRTDTYILLHNQDGRNTKVAEQVDSALGELVAAGVAKTVHQWDRQQFLEAIQKELSTKVAERLSEQSSHLIAQLDSQFRFGRTYITDVPVRHQSLTLRRGEAPLIRDVRPGYRTARIADLLASTTDRWMLLLGVFGSGKTSAALHAASSSPLHVLYVHAGSLGDSMHHGTNAIMARLLSALAIFGDFEHDERVLFDRLASPLVSRLLIGKNTSAVLIIDALDENHFLGTPTGVSSLASALAELSCPIVLTTRVEHFRSTLGNFDHLFDELSIKGGNMDDIALLELHEWGQDQIGQMVVACASEDPENNYLSSFAEKVASGHEAGWPAELLAHPLFLRMIIDLVAEGSAPSENRATLIESWVWQKLARDLKSNRVLPIHVVERNDFLERMEFAMERVAAAMLSDSSDAPELLETLPSNEIIAHIQQALEVASLDLVSSISVSLLIPTDVRFRGSVPVRFSHRIIQEYFLARHIIAAGLEPSLFPSAVQSLVADLRKARTE